MKAQPGTFVQLPGFNRLHPGGDALPFFSHDKADVRDARGPPPTSCRTHVSRKDTLPMRCCTV